MEELKIYEYQAKHILDTLKLAARIHNSKSKETCFDRDVMQAIGMMENAKKGKIDEMVYR